MRAHKVESHTAAVERILRERDDFMRRSEIAAVAGITEHQAGTALWHLHAARAVGVEIDKTGVGWWYAMPKELDTRSRRILEHRPIEAGVTKRPQGKRTQPRKSPVRS